MNRANVGVGVGDCGTSLGPLASVVSALASLAAVGALAVGVTTFFVGVKYRPPFEEENTEYVRARSGGACDRSSERNIAPPLLVVVDEQEGVGNNQWGARCWRKREFPECRSYLPTKMLLPKLDLSRPVGKL